MRRGRGPYKLAVVLVTAATLLLLAAVGASAASGSFGSAKVVKSIVTLLAANSVGVTNNAATPANKANEGGNGNGNGNGKNKCKGDDDDHQTATGGHDNHPCDDGDEVGGGGN